MLKYLRCRYREEKQHFLTHLTLLSVPLRIAHLFHPRNTRLTVWFINMLWVGGFFFFLLLQILSLRRNAEALKPCECLWIWGETTQNFPNWTRGNSGFSSLCHPRRLLAFVPIFKKTLWIKSNVQENSCLLLKCCRNQGGKIFRVRRGRGCAGGGRDCVPLGLASPIACVISLIFLFHCWF